MSMDQVDTLHVEGIGLKFYAVPLLVIITHLYDLEVNVMDLEILCLNFG